MQYSKEFLLSSSVIDLNRNQSSAYISQGLTILHKYRTYSFNGSVAFDNKRAKGRRESGRAKTGACMRACLICSNAFWQVSFQQKGKSFFVRFVKGAAIWQERRMEFLK